MKTSWFRFSALSIAFVASGLTACGAGDIQDFEGSDEYGFESDGSDAADEALESMELGTTEQALMSCTNPDGTNSAMAAIAVAAAQELKRWQPTKDFVMFNTSGQCETCAGQQQAIKLTSGSDASGAKGKSRCSDGKCATLQALLDMQYEQANNKVYFQGSGTTKTLLSPAALRARLVAKLYEQKACDDSAKDNDVNACPKEEHVLAFQSAAKGSCDTNFFFKATKPNGQALQYPQQLKNKLKFADQSNPYIAFQNLGNGIVSVDPTYGLNPDGSTQSGSCTAACTKVSSTSIAGQCCSCAGVNKTFVKAAWSGTTFICQ
jgi:hypothetical protein